MKNFKRLLKLALANFWRNKWLSLAAIFMISLTLLVISLSITLNIVVSSTTNSLKDKIDLVVYFNDSASDDQIALIKKQIEGRSDIKTVDYVSKDEAYQEWINSNTKDRIKNVVTPTENPLPRSLEIKTIDPEHLDGVYNYLSLDQFKEVIESISYQRNKEIIKKLINITKFSKQLGLILSSIFIIIAVLVILNTLRLTIFTRKDEVEIMKLVGASDYFIRLPFVIEAMFYSLFACLASTSLLGLIFYFIGPVAKRYLGETPFDISQFFWHNLGWIILLQFATGLVISISCSLIALRRHLKI